MDRDGSESERDWVRDRDGERNGIGKVSCGTPSGGCVVGRC